MGESVHVTEDDGLYPSEKETTFTWAKDEDVVHVHTEIGGVMRRLLSHPHFEESWRRENEGDVVAVAGTLPLGVLSVSSNPRKHGSHAAVITAQVLRDDDGG